MGDRRFPPIHSPISLISTTQHGRSRQRFIHRLSAGNSAKESSQVSSKYDSGGFTRPRKPERYMEMDDDEVQLNNISSMLTSVGANPRAYDIEGSLSISSHSQDVPGSGNLK